MRLPFGLLCLRMQKEDDGALAGLGSGLRFIFSFLGSISLPPSPSSLLPSLFRCSLSPSLLSPLPSPIEIIVTKPIFERKENQAHATCLYNTPFINSLQPMPAGRIVYSYKNVSYFFINKCLWFYYNILF